MPDHFTATMLENASKRLPGKDEQTGDWWADRHLEESTIGRLAIDIRDRTPNAHSPATWIVVGMMLGFELGRLAADPSFALAAELQSNVKTRLPLGPE